MKYRLRKDDVYGYITVDPKPTIEEVNRFYEEEFYSSNYGKFNDSELIVQKEELAFFESNWDRVQDVLKGQLKNISNPKLFDIGFGYGLTLDYFKNRGFEVSGLEPSSKGFEYAKKKGYHVYHSGVEGFFEQVDEKAHVVTMFNVLEHLREPEKVIREISNRLLENEGYLVIDVPNEFNDFQVLANELYDLNEWWVCPPNHINYFNSSSLKKLLDDNGFEVIDCYSSFPLEMFMLMGDVYVGNGTVGKQCHNKRVLFEKNMTENGKKNKLMQLYRSFADLDLGRQITIIGKKRR